MAAYGFNIAGLVLDLVGVVVLIWHAGKTKGVTQDWEQLFLPRGHWYLSAFYLGVLSIVLGFVLQLVGNVLGLLGK